MEVVPDFPQLKFVLGLQEGVVMAMADGYCRASNKLAAANVHVAPGLGNAMGALYNAKFSGSPVILTAGQQEQGHGLLEPLLYDPLVPIAQPMVKWAVDVTRAEDLPRIMHRAAKIALTPPTGPVFISLPGDVLDQTVEVDMGRPVRVDAANRPSDETLATLAERLLASKRPVILAGQELSIRDAFSEAAELAELLGAAVYQSPIPYTAQFPTEHPACMGSLTRSQVKVRAALEPYDLLFCLGADLLRMSVYSPMEPLPENLPVIHLSERSGELGKNYRTDLAIQANVKETLKALLPLLRSRRTPEAAAQAAKRIVELKPHNWSSQRDKARIDAMMAAETSPIDPKYLMLRITETLPKDAVVVEEGLTSSVSLAGFLPLRDPQALVRAGQRRPGLRHSRSGRGQPGAAGQAGGRNRRRRQHDVRRAGAVDRRAPQAADHLHHRQQPQLPDHQGAAGGDARHQQVHRHGPARSRDRFRASCAVVRARRAARHRSAGHRPGPARSLRQRQAQPGGHARGGRLRRLSLSRRGGIRTSPFPVRRLPARKCARKSSRCGLRPG